MNERCRHDQELAGDVEVEALHELQRRQILLRDRGNRDIRNADFVFFYEMKEQIERTFKNLKLNVCAHNPNVARTSAMVSAALR